MMGCTRFMHKDGQGNVTTGFMCFRGKSVKPCRVCGLPAVALCDWPVATGKTCDAPLCEAHRHSIGTNLDLCPVHHKQWRSPGDRVVAKDGHLEIREAV